MKYLTELAAQLADDTTVRVLRFDTIAAGAAVAFFAWVLVQALT